MEKKGSPKNSSSWQGSNIYFKKHNETIPYNDANGGVYPYSTASVARVKVL